VQKDTNLRVVYGRGLARPNIGDLVPATVIDPNQTPYPTVSTGNPNLVPTKSNNYDILVEHYFQPLGILQAGWFYKQLSDPIYPTANLIPNFNGTGTTYQLTQSINGPGAHIQGFEAQWEQRFSFLPGLLGGFGVNANYSHTASQVTFPAGFDGGRTDKLALDRDSPNDYNFNLTYDKGRFSGRFAISHNDASIAAYQWNAGTGPAERSHPRDERSHGRQLFLSSYAVRCAGKLPPIQRNTDRSLRPQPQQRTVWLLQWQRNLSCTARVLQTDNVVRNTLVHTRRAIGG
jgi:TonB-dependent receptor